MSLRRFAHSHTFAAVAARGFAVTAKSLAPDPAELERERQLRERLIKNPGAMFGNQGGEAAGQQTADPSKGSSSASAAAGAGSRGGFWQQFQQFHEMRNAQRAAAGSDPGSNTQTAGPSNERPGPMKIVASFILLYASFKLLFRARGQDLSHTVIPYWVSSYETQAKYLLMSFVMDTNVRSMHEAGFAQARRVRPLLTFFEYLDQVDPNWCSGLRTPRDRVVNTLTGALCTLSPWQVVSLANRLNYQLQGSRASTPEKVDVVFETTTAHLGGPRALMANVLGGSGNGNVPVLRLSGNGSGPMSLSDGSGHSIPVQPLSQLHPVVLHQSSHPIPPGMLPFAQPPMPISTPVVAPPGGAFPTPYYPAAPVSTRPNGGADFGDTMDSERPHGTVPVFK